MWAGTMGKDRVEGNSFIGSGTEEGGKGREIRTEEGRGWEERRKREGEGAGAPMVISKSRRLCCGGAVSPLATS